MRGIEAVLAWNVHERKAEITRCDARLRELRKGSPPDSSDERDHVIATRRDLSAKQGEDKGVLRRNGARPLPKRI